MALTHDAIFAADANVAFPTGYAKPTTAITHPGVATVEVKNYTYSMPRASGVSTTELLGIAAMHTAFETWLAGTFVPTLMGVDIVSDTVTAIATYTKIVADSAGDDMWLDDASGVLNITFDCTFEFA
jgi:hypothetical protein